MTGWREASVLIPLSDRQDVQRRGPYLQIIDGCIETLLIALLAFMPFALGAAQPWSHSLVMDGCLALCIGLLLRSFSADSAPIRWSWAFLPILLFFALVVFQLLPLPANWVHLLSANTAARRLELLSDSPLAPASLHSFPLSFYPLTTEHDLRLIVCTSIVFLTVATVIRSRAQVVRLLIAIASIGAAVAAVAALQDLSGAQAIYWTISTPASTANAGPFVLYNNYAQFMNLSIGAAIALLLYLLGKGQTKDRGARSDRSRSRSRSSRSTSSPAPKWQIVCLTAFIIVAACTVLLSGSRGGTLSLIASFFALVLLLGRKRSMKRQSWILLVVGGAIFGSLLYAGFDAVCDRLATLHNSQDPTSGRLQSFKDTASIWQRFPIFGTGLGTHQYVYPAYDHSTDPNLAEQADGDYIQALEEVGAAGLLLILCFVGFIAWRCAAIISIDSSQSSRASPNQGLALFAYGLGFGLLAVILHSFVDFGQHLPAIGCLSAAFCGLLFSIHSTLTSEAFAPDTTGSIDIDERQTRRFTLPRLVTCVVALALTSATAWGALAADRGRRADAYAAQAADYAVDLSTNHWQGGQDQYVQLLSTARNAADAEPRDITNQYWLNCYRWQAISRPKDSAATGIVLTSQDVGFAQRIVADLDRSRTLCPVYGPALAVMGQIEYFALGHSDSAATHVELACKLWPNHPAVCLAAGSINAAEGRWDPAMVYLRRCLLLNSALYPQVLQILLIEHHRPDLAVAVSDGDPGRLLEVVRYLPKADPQSNTLAATARAKAIAELDLLCVNPEAPAWILAQTAYLHRENNDKNLAIELFRRALSIDYGQVGWRLGLADLLKSDGQIAQAAHEAKICLRLRPQMPEAVRFIAELNALPGVHLDELDP